MKRLFIFLFTLAVGLVFSMQAHAALETRGTDSLGNRLIYDSVLDITWYDYSNAKNTWQNQANWASGLSVDFYGNIYDDWRLPTTVDGTYEFGYNGTTTAGFNITSSEMGHLFYTGLGNNGWLDTAGNETGCGINSPWCLTNTGDFQNLQSDFYWSGTEYSANPTRAWYYCFIAGCQGEHNKGASGYALAVRPGDVAVAPEPVSTILFGAGGVVLAARRMMLKRLHG